jgi:hypothetical protein
MTVALSKSKMVLRFVNCDSRMHTVAYTDYCSRSGRALVTTHRIVLFILTALTLFQMRRRLVNLNFMRGFIA